MASSASSRAWVRLRRDRLAAVSAAVILLLVLVGLVGPGILLNWIPDDISANTLAPPSWTTPLGTDELGRDVGLELMLGIRTSLAVGILAAISATVVGIGLGALAGFCGGLVEAAVMRITEMFQVMPNFILAAVIVAFAGPGMFRVIAVIALLSWPEIARVTRGEVMRVKSLEFVDAARCLGIGEQRILWFDIVPNALSAVIALGTLIVGQAILLEASLAFFGLTSPDVPSWGLMLHSGQRFFYQAWWLSVFPGIAILVTVLAFNLLGDSVTTAFSPRASERA